MNDQHPHAGYVTDATQTTGSYAVDPLFGTYDTGYDAGQTSHTGYVDQSGYTGYSDHGGQWDTGSYGSYTATGQWDASAWTEAQQTGQYEAAPFASHDATTQWTAPGFETGTYDATAWNQVAPEAVVPQQYTPEHSSEYPAEHSPEPSYDFSHENAASYGSYDAYASPESAAYETPQYEAPQYETSAYDAPRYETPQYDAAAYETASYETASYEEPTAFEPELAEYAEDLDQEPDAFHDAETMIALEIDPDLLPGQGPAPDADLPARPVRRSGGGSRGRRRTPAKRSALLTVAVPSACVMGVAGIAAASVSGLTDTADAKDDTTSMAAADPASVKQVAANSKLDTQLAALSADARDFGERASRTQERIDLKIRQDAERKKREEEAARKEALRPKFMLPVKLHQLSARFGQAGVNWMSTHTGIDFPVQYGTKVMSATDGTVRTQWNSAYGNMAIVTAPDGTETWYCHLSSTKIRSGKVKAGEVIAYSGNSGNSTGPHLHFEVRPNGGAAIDPLPWLLSHGLNPLS
ncbi:peptidoglycan DD-metalloendopeptidase family protein [Streptomyces sp. NPDC101191]|uniref:peptidoglycan DD-metalloendopeptidase family protein n=1 Tax=Streptomyces sp. NPDC101191 TaxID=3366126 RepID=UPI00380C8F8B